MFWFSDFVSLHESIQILTALFSRESSPAVSSVYPFILLRPSPGSANLTIWEEGWANKLYKLNNVVKTTQNYHAPMQTNRNIVRDAENGMSLFLTAATHVHIKRKETCLLCTRPQENQTCDSLLLISSTMSVLVFNLVLAIFIIKLSKRLLSLLSQNQPHPNPDEIQLLTDN